MIRFLLLLAVYSVCSAVGSAEEVAGVAGAVPIKFTMPADGQATVALYTKEGRLVRAVAQCLPLAKGDHLIRWDGMDLWGYLVPAGTELNVKVITGPGLRAFYEFTPNSAGNPPWPTKPVGEGDAMRAGGWLADHTPSIAAAACGERVFLGSPLAEYGNSLICVNLAGEKLWGGGLKGWGGPNVLAADGQMVYALDKGKRDVYSLHPVTFERVKLFTLKNEANAIAAHAGKLFFGTKAGLETIQTNGSVVATLPVAERIGALACDADGTLYAVASNKLCRVDAGKLTVLNDKTLQGGFALAVGANRLVVGEGERHGVYIFDKAGKLVATIGGKGWRTPGTFDPNTVEAPRGLAIDKTGKLWVAENRYAPRRVSRWTLDGKFDKAFHGPAEYGGGGFLDPDLKSFYYQTQQFALDFEKGTWSLAALNGRFSDPKHPMLSSGAMGNTKVGRAVWLNGRRYIVGDPAWQGEPGAVICALDPGSSVWRPCAIMGKAPGLLGREFWKEHWSKQDLKDKSYIWCDRNEDGDYQVEEVELVNGNPFSYSYWGNWIGSDLTVSTPNCRLAVSRFTEKRGVPIYEAAKIQPFDYAKLAPYYSNAEKRSIGTSDGGIVVAHEPYFVKPDLTLLGGPVEVKPSGFKPPVAGQRYGGHHFVGSAVTKSPVGEVVAYNGSSWYFESARDRVVVGKIFTGETGGWSTDLKAERGIEVTGRNHPAETFFGHFVKGDNGKYYVVVGKNFQAICRVEGLDDYRVEQQPLQVTAEMFAANEKLRPTIVAGTGKAEKPKVTAFRPVAGPVVPIADGLAFSGQWSKDGLTLKYQGTTPVGNDSDDWRFIFKTGFCFDLMLRTDPKAKDAKVVAGDRRIVFGQHKGKWIAVLYDYVNAAAGKDEGVSFSSPLVTTRVARVAQLPDVAIKFQKADKPADPKRPTTFAWNAEVTLPWNALGITAPTGKTDYRMDFGILAPDSGGTTVEKRSYWCDRNTEMTADLGVEAQIHPGNWGTATLEMK
jgi:hypothetical protein